MSIELNTNYLISFIDDKGTNYYLTAGQDGAEASLATLQNNCTGGSCPEQIWEMKTSLEAGNLKSASGVYLDANYEENTTPICTSNENSGYTLALGGHEGAATIKNNNDIYLDGTNKVAPKGKGNSQTWKFTKTTIGIKPMMADPE
jgi:hypothetical protein